MFTLLVTKIWRNLPGDLMFTLEYSPAMMPVFLANSFFAWNSVLSKKNVLFFVLQAIQFKQIYHAFLNLNLKNIIQAQKTVF